VLKYNKSPKLEHKTIKIKIIILSDSHGSSLFLKKAMAIHSDADAFAHLGDGLSEFITEAEQYINKQIIYVAGNCDFYLNKNLITKKNPPREILLELDGFKLFFTHGHNLGIKESPERLIWRAAELGADAAFYGHTHIPRCEYISNKSQKPFYLVCPGSISRPRQSKASYAIAETYNNKLICHTSEINA